MMHQRVQQRMITAALLTGVLLTGCNRQQQPMAFPTPEVSVVTVQPQKVVLTSELPGRTSGYLVAEIRPQVNGLLEKRFFQEGADVKAGELLYQIDPAPYEAAYANATANLAVAHENVDRAKAVLETSQAALRRHEAILELAKTNLRRYEKLVKTQAASAMQRDQAAADVEVADSGLKVAKSQVNGDQQGVEAAEASIKQAEAAVKTAKINLDYTKITAPISGRIGRSNITEGAIVTAYQPTPLAIIQQFDPIYIDVPQSTVELNRLRRNLAAGDLNAAGTDKVKIVLEDGTAYPLEGSLKFRDVTVEPSTGSVTLRIVVPNPDGMLLPGMFVRAVIEEGIRENAILVPQQAVSRNTKGEPYALVVSTVDAEDANKQKIKKEVVKLRQLVTDRPMGDKWLVSSGLAKGDRVIYEGAQRVRPDGEVKVIRTQIGGTLAASPKDVKQTTTN